MQVLTPEQPDMCFKNKKTYVGSTNYPIAERKRNGHKRNLTLDITCIVQFVFCHCGYRDSTALRAAEGRHMTASAAAHLALL